jgi:cell wall-associated NlpC family hydrolase
VLQTAVNLIGYPYVWGGTSAGAQTLFGVSSRGRFDCSGFAGESSSCSAIRAAWRSQRRFAGGRTTAQMASASRTQRIQLAELEPGDVMFFGRGGRRAKAAAIDRAGIYLGGGWMINSSRYGVALAPVIGWYADRFAWGRRLLAEARLG